MSVCDDCGAEIGNDSGPPDGWQLECGRTVCQACCVEDIKEIVSILKQGNTKLGRIR